MRGDNDDKRFAIIDFNLLLMFFMFSTWVFLHPRYYYVIIINNNNNTQFFYKNDINYFERVVIPNTLDLLSLE